MESRVVLLMMCIVLERMQFVLIFYFYNGVKTTLGSLPKPLLTIWLVRGP